MRLIRQKRGNDCGVAAVAMTASVSYEKALAAFDPEVQRRMTTLRAGTVSSELREALRRLGCDCDGRLRALRKRDLMAVEGRAIVAVRYPGAKKSENWHWMAYCSNEGDPKILDPATHLHDYRVDSFMRVWKCGE